MVTVGAPDRVPCDTTVWRRRFVTCAYTVDLVGLCSKNKREGSRVLRLTKLRIAVAAVTIATTAGLTLNAVPSAQATQATMTPAGSTCKATITKGAGATLLQFCVTQEGNVTTFKTGATADDIPTNEGYMICNDGAYDMGGIGSSGWNPATFNEPGGPDTLPITVTRTTTDGIWQLTQTYTSAADSVTITMVLKNLSAVTQSAT